MGQTRRPRSARPRNGHGARPRFSRISFPSRTPKSQAALLLNRPVIPLHPSTPRAAPQTLAAAALFAPQRRISAAAIPGVPRRPHHGKPPGELRPEATNFAEPAASDLGPAAHGISRGEAPSSRPYAAPISTLRHLPSTSTAGVSIARG